MSSLAQSNEIPAPVADDVAGHGGHHPEGAHAVPRRVLLGIFGLLCMLTIITVGVSYIDLGPANIWVALFVAVIKGGLVVMYFMHLRWDSPFNGVILIAAMFFVALFIGIAMLDSKEYQPNLEKPELVQQFSSADTTPTLPGGAPAPTPGPILAGTMTADDVAKILKEDPTAREPRIPAVGVQEAMKAAGKDPGDPILGMALFQSKGCVTCHTTSKEQWPRAPYLGDVTVRHDKAYVFESILLPSAKIADGFTTHYYKMKDQNMLQGFLVAQDRENYTIRDTNGVVTIIPKVAVVKTGIIKKSVMPEALGDTLSVHDLASIYAFLDSLNNSTVASR